MVNITMHLYISKFSLRLNMHCPSVSLYKMQPILYSVYRVIFALCYLITLLHSQTVLPHLEFAQMKYMYSLRHWICPVLYSPIDNKGERGRNKKGEYFTINYTVCAWVRVPTCIKVTLISFFRGGWHFLAFI